MSSTRRTARFALGAAALCLTAPPSHAGTNGLVKDPATAEITRLYHLSDHLADAQDAATAGTLVSSDFVLIGPKGDRHNRTQILSSLKANYAQMATMGFHTHTATVVQSVRVTGDRAEVRYRQHQVLQHGARALSLDATGEDQWVYTPGGWKEAVAHVLTARQSHPLTSLLSPGELAALNTLIAVRNRAALQNLDDSVTLFNQTLAIDQSQNDVTSRQIHEEEQRRRHREIYGY